MAALGRNITDMPSWITASWKRTGNGGQEAVIRTPTVIHGNFIYFGLEA
jgi:hypothetical protein